MTYDSENLTTEQYDALLSFTGQIAAALKAGVPPAAIQKHVYGILSKLEICAARKG